MARNVAILSASAMLLTISVFVAAENPGNELTVAGFEAYPNNLGGELGVHGSLEANWQDQEAPFSWYYTPETPGYKKENVFSGDRSFRLVNARGSKPDETWGSFGVDLGPTVDSSVVPKRIRPLDVSGYKFLTFWVKGEKGGEHIELVFRDSHAPDYMPQIKIKVADATSEWQRIVIPLDKISNQVDLTSLVLIGFAFGNDVGNPPGGTIYLDNIAFTNEPGKGVLN